MVPSLSAAVAKPEPKKLPVIRGMVAYDAVKQTIVVIIARVVPGEEQRTILNTIPDGPLNDELMVCCVNSAIKHLVPDCHPRVDYANLRIMYGVHGKTFNPWKPLSEQVK